MDPVTYKFGNLTVIKDINRVELGGMWPSNMKER